MITGIDLKATKDYTLKNDKKNPTVWKIAAISSSIMAEIASVLSVTNPAKRMFLIVKAGLRGWTNFKVAGQDIGYNADKDGVSPDLMDIIPLPVIIEIGTEILNISNLTLDEEKN